MFATLDPTLRRLALPDGGALILADTVGFISNLPHELVAAFHSTLQETAEAALLLHVIDAAAAHRGDQVAEVEDVLGQIGAAEVPRIEVYNKLDRLPGSEPRIERDASGRPIRVWLSAKTGDGIDLLLQALQETFHGDWVQTTVHLTPADGRLRAALFRDGTVLSEAVTEDGGWDLRVSLPRRDLERLRKRDVGWERLLESAQT